MIFGKKGRLTAVGAIGGALLATLTLTACGSGSPTSTPTVSLPATPTAAPRTSTPAGPTATPGQQSRSLPVAPDLVLGTRNGQTTLLALRGKVVLLYFSFPG